MCIVHKWSQPQLKYLKYFDRSHVLLVYQKWDVISNYCHLQKVCNIRSWHPFKLTFSRDINSAWRRDWSRVIFMITIITDLFWNRIAKNKIDSTHDKIQQNVIEEIFVLSMFRQQVVDLYFIVSMWNRRKQFE